MLNRLSSSYLQIEETRGSVSQGMEVDGEAPNFTLGGEEAKDLAEEYKRALGPEQISTFDSNLPRAYNRYDAAMDCNEGRQYVSCYSPGRGVEGS